MRVNGPADYYVPELTPEQYQAILAFFDGTGEYCPDGIPPTTLYYMRSIENSKSMYRELVAKGMLREQARGLLGTAFYTRFVWNVNLREWAHWYGLRSHKSAQREHRDYALAAMQELAANPQMNEILTAMSL
jgi:hypothetical protein